MVISLKLENLSHRTSIQFIAYVIWCGAFKNQTSVKCVLRHTQKQNENLGSQICVIFKFMKLEIQKMKGFYYSRAALEFLVKHHICNPEPWLLDVCPKMKRALFLV